MPHFSSQDHLAVCLAIGCDFISWAKIICRINSQSDLRADSIVIVFQGGNARFLDDGIRLVAFPNLSTIAILYNDKTFGYDIIKRRHLKLASLVPSSTPSFVHVFG